MVEKKKMPKIDLSKYPNLSSLDKEKRSALMSGLLKMADRAVELGHLDVAEKYFNLPYHEVVSEILAGVFDTEAILKNHGEPDITKYLFELHQHAEHPLYAALNEVGLVDRDGEEITFEEKFGCRRKDFSIKQWIEGLLFLSWYLNPKDYASALSTNNWKLVDEAKARYLPRLLKIQPVLKKQAEHGVLIGKLIPGSGYFDIAVPAEELRGECIVCDSLDLVEHETYVGCRRCQAGYKKEE